MMAKIPFIFVLLLSKQTINEIYLRSVLALLAIEGNGNSVEFENTIE